MACSALCPAVWLFLHLWSLVGPAPPVQNDLSAIRPEVMSKQRCLSSKAYGIKQVNPDLSKQERPSDEIDNNVRLPKNKWDGCDEC